MILEYNRSGEYYETQYIGGMIDLMLEITLDFIIRQGNTGSL